MGDHPSIDKTICLESSTLYLREKEPLTTDYTSSQTIFLVDLCVCGRPEVTPCRWRDVKIQEFTNFLFSAVDRTLKPLY